MNWHTLDWDGYSPKLPDLADAWSVAMAPPMFERKEMKLTNVSAFVHQMYQEAMISNKTFSQKDPSTGEYRQWRVTAINANVDLYGGCCYDVTLTEVNLHAGMWPTGPLYQIPQIDTEPMPVKAGPIKDKRGNLV